MAQVSHVSASNNQGVVDYEAAWVLSEEQVVYYTKQFARLQPDLYSFIDAIAAKDFFSKSGLDTSCLSQIWDLSDVNKDGVLSLDEFCIAMHLSVGRRHGLPIPASLPRLLFKVAGEVNRIASIFSKHCLDQQTTAHRSFEGRPSVAPVGQSAPHVESATTSSWRGFGFDDDFGSHVIASGDSQPLTSDSNYSHKSSDLFNNVPPHVFNQPLNHPAIPPRVGVVDASNPPPSHPPPALRNPQTTPAVPSITPRASAQIYSVTPISVEIDPNAFMSKSNAQLIKELRDLVMHRNQLDSQIEALQQLLRSESSRNPTSAEQPVKTSPSLADGKAQVSGNCSGSVVPS